VGRPGQGTARLFVKARSEGNRSAKGRKKEALTWHGALEFYLITLLLLRSQAVLVEPLQRLAPPNRPDTSRRMFLLIVGDDERRRIVRGSGRRSGRKK
jgi:hypothetical protein